MKILGIDPGLATGIALYDTATRDLETWVTGDGIVGFSRWFNLERGRFYTSEVVALERYLPDGSVTGEDGIHSLRIEGLLLGLVPERVTLQARSDKATVVNGSERYRNKWLLERFPGVTTQHSKDALVHILVWLRRNDPRSVRWVYE